MKERRLGRQWLQSHLPIFESMATWLLLDRLHAPGWVWGVGSTLFIFIWCGAVYSLFAYEACEPVLKEAPK